MGKTARKIPLFLLAIAPWVVGGEDHHDLPLKRSPDSPSYSAAPPPRPDLMFRCLELGLLNCGAWIRRSVGSLACSRRPVLSPDPPRYGRAAMLPMSPSAVRMGLSLAWQLLLRFMPILLSVDSCPVTPHPDRVGALGSDAAIAPVHGRRRAAIYSRRNSGRLRCGATVPRSLSTATSQLSFPY